MTEQTSERRAKQTKRTEKSVHVRKHVDCNAALIIAVEVSRK